MVKNRAFGIILTLLLIFLAINPQVLSTYAWEVREVYLGGYPVGIEIYRDGAIVDNVIKDYTIEGNIKKGDTIVKINDKAIHSRADVNTLLSDKTIELPLRIDLLRKNNVISTTIMPDIVESNPKVTLGVTLKDGLSGLGTITCIDSNNKFYALGHAISDADCNSDYECRDGFIYECAISGIKKPSMGKAGRLIGKYTQNREPLGRIEINSSFGLYGENAATMQNNKKIKTLPHDEVKVGSAQILTTINGEPEYFDIEIVKAVKQNSPAEKGMVIKVVDKRLIDKTGGILQGMSGSPIIQNGRLAGAVTHVFTNDAIRGYGVYIDWVMR